VGIEGITLEMLSDVVEVTGPKIMTVAIMESLGQLLGRTVDDRDFAHTKRPKLVGDVLIMPGVSFAALQNSNPTDQGDPLVTHHYEGSWKKEDAEAKERKKAEARTGTAATAARRIATTTRCSCCDLIKVQQRAKSGGLLSSCLVISFISPGRVSFLHLNPNRQDSRFKEHNM
jgi:hypothetical protein